MALESLPRRLLLNLSEAVTVNALAALEMSLPRISEPDKDPRCPGLASTVMSADLGKAGRVANQIRAGAVYATDTGDGILNEFPKCASPLLIMDLYIFLA